MRSQIYRLWPLFFLTAFLFMPKITFAADWVNIGFADKNIKTVYADPKNNQHIIVSLVSNLDNNYNYYTENGGTTWQAVNMGGSMTSCNNFVQNPKTPSEVWAGCNPGLFYSIDGGKNFTLASNYFRYAQDSRVNISVNGVVYVSTAAQELWRSDGGLVWEQLLVPGGGYPVTFLNKYKANEIYVSKTGSTNPGLYKSNDGGNTWSYIYSAVPIRNGVNQLAFTPGGKMYASVGITGIGYSTDSGFTWSPFVSPNINVPHEYQHSYRLEQNPDDDENLLVLASTWGGLDTKIYSYKSGSSIPEIVTVPDMTGAITISQGIVFSWSPNNGWTKGIWRNDGIAVVPEYLKKHPVIIVPGILGSWRKTNSSEFTLDPVLHTYTDLVNAFLANNYKIGENLFLFPYNWRLDNKYSAVLLKQKIDEAKSISGAQKVDIVAHSMGGLVAREYAESTTYQEDIDQIIFLGTPHLGSPSVYPIWESGDVTFNKDKITGAVAKYIFTEEASKNGYLGEYAVYNYIRNKVPSVQQLLPINDYLGWYGSGQLFAYPTLYPHNTFLEQLELNKQIIKQRNISVTNIVTNNLTVPSGFGLTAYPYLNSIWEDGIPYNYYSDRIGVNYGIGDGTVPIASALGLEGNSVIINSIEHSDIPKQTIDNIFRALNIEYKNKPNFLSTVKKYLLISAYSPVDFYVLAPDGKKIGFNKNGEIFNEIEGAFYAGNDSETEFITIPNPLTGIYKVITYGTDIGEYEIEATYADDERNVSFSSSYVGQAELGIEDNLIVTLSPETDSIKTNVEDKTAPNVVIDLNKSIFAHWDTLILSCAVSDDESGVDEFIVKVDGVNVNCEETINLFEHSLGSHTVEYIAKDKAGNVTSGEKQYVVEANYNSLVRDIVWLYENKHFKNRGDAISLLAQVEISRFFNLLERWQKSADSLSRALQLVEKSKEKNRIDTYGYDMIIKDINYILEGK